MLYKLKRSQCLKTIEHHIKQAGPYEACGLIVMGKNGHHYHPCQNHAHNPENSFLISPEDYLLASASGQIIVIVHSHPSGPPALSEADRMMQKLSGVDWWLVCEGTIYSFGVNDREERKYVFPI